MLKVWVKYSLLYYHKDYKKVKKFASNNYSLINKNTLVYELNHLT